MSKHFIRPPLFCFAAAEYCSPVRCRSKHTHLIDKPIHDALRLVTGCLRPTPIDNLFVLEGITFTELRRKRAILSWPLTTENDATYRPSWVNLNHTSFLPPITPSKRNTWIGGSRQCHCGLASDNNTEHLTRSAQTKKLQFDVCTLSKNQGHRQREAVACGHPGFSYMVQI